MIRHCKDIDMFALDRGRSSCIYKTNFCKKHCYNNKFYDMNIGLNTRDKKNDFYWKYMDGDVIKKSLSTKRLPTKRFRFCTRGEPFKELQDIYKLYDICIKNPNTKFWTPTRAWRHDTVIHRIIKVLLPLNNFFLTCSLDPSNTQEEFDFLNNLGLSTGFFGNDITYPFKTASIIKCPNKWGNKNITCANCNSACFIHKQTHHWLKEH